MFPFVLPEIFCQEFPRQGIISYSINHPIVMVFGMGDEESWSKPLGRASVFYYGVGHMLNDITSACWFTYLLVFLTDIGLTPRNTATVMLSGQIADGFTTIFAGELIDRFGHFKIWHGAGSVLVAVSFSSVFGICLPCKIFRTNSSAILTISYSTFAAIFNVGWAATQVSHMSMVNCITLNPTTRVVLASCRNAFTMVANLSLYAVALTVFNVSKPRTPIDIENQYRWIAYLSIFIGCCFVSIFLIGTKEPRLKQGIHGTSNHRISWAHWFKKVLYYQVAIVYVLTRLVTNVSQAFLAFYVINDLQMAQSSKALHCGICHFTGDYLDWPTSQGLLYCWRCSLDIFWCGDPFSSQYHAKSYVPFISGYWCCQCINDGDRSEHAKCFSWRRFKWLCICLWVIELLGQNLMRACFVHS
ncbi:PREDICTED: major facilitator superfamily domain-containing protein 12-like isoform X4 [Nelumbo nucifera]|uniref:Major facilitator superfamily domain-containing protein 12-like isoform X4 n=1 Tax=Nelumbo nucifera TaxID=4432 RepID=A0A1U8A6S0_NELNU|nr:PREDICTED: major facilitator superfamily domain-containing protein 12-like isoform X4 [Nelumbo nucifera]XP_010257583.1 PREDICTED: major facilitator superfamily domain-containing protein 12-like isoform X4 [Nelumbo nucifera]